MTCIVGIADGVGGVHIGGDSFGSDGHTGVVLAEPKIFQLGEFIIGYCGSFRMGQILQYQFEPPAREEGQTDMSYLTVSFIDMFRHTLEVTRFFTKEESIEEKMGPCVLGYRGEVYVIQDDLAVLHVVDDFVSVGAGSEVANAVLYATRELALDPVSRLGLALDTAAYQITSVRGPFHVISWNYMKDAGEVKEPQAFKGASFLKGKPAKKKAKKKVAKKKAKKKVVKKKVVKKKASEE